MKLAGTLVYPPETRAKFPAILFVNGWGNERQRSFEYAEALSKLGYLCFLFDMRGQGESEGDSNLLSNKDFFEDICAAYDYLKETGITDKISVFGTSFGGYLSALLTSKRQVADLVLRVPADYPDELFDRSVLESSNKNPKVFAWRQHVRPADSSDALKAVHTFKGNILIIESERDEKIPHQIIESYIKAVHDPTKLTHICMKGAVHNSRDIKFISEVERIIVDWFSSLDIV